MADDRRNGEDFEQINNDRDRDHDRNEMGRSPEEAIGRGTEDEFEVVDEANDSEDNLSDGSE